MLLSNEYQVVQSLIDTLTFEDGTIKKTRIDIGDTLTITYNNNAVRKTITGVVKSISVEYSRYTSLSTYDCTNEKTLWYMTVDASSTGSSAVERVYFKNILDLDMVKKASEYNSVTSPIGKTNITDIRISNGVFEISSDNGETWAATSATTGTTKTET